MLIDFLDSQSGMILYNSTCMCLQTLIPVIAMMLSDVKSGEYDALLDDLARARG